MLRYLVGLIFQAKELLTTTPPFNTLYATFIASTSVFSLRRLISPSCRILLPHSFICSTSYLSKSWYAVTFL